MLASPFQLKFLPRLPMAVQVAQKLSRVSEGAQFHRSEQAAPPAKVSSDRHHAARASAKSCLPTDCTDLTGALPTHQEVCRRRQRGQRRVGKS